MTMSNEYSIKVENVAKMYKMYKSNFAKISDLLGLPFKKDYDEFWPLKDINFTIKKGEKVGIIGRNGAGKTTLLSMIADNIKPTMGKISVVGQVNALFVLGTGFHPEFSGRENIYSSLAFQGIVGNEAKRLEKDIVEFAELEQFIDQPVKTYSAGMYARLAFTVATAIEPEILIIDEILGAGDAYFNAKALERMSELTNGGSTVLFVSHDLSSVQKICDRTIWIDRGKIRKDGKTLEVIKAYSADVRKREELRLLAKNTGVLLDKNDLENNRQYIFRFITSDAKAPKTGFIIHKISLYKGNLLIEDILVGDSMDNSILENAHLITDKRLINWGEPKKIDEKWCREFIDIGGKNIHAAGVFIVNDDIEDELYFEIEYKDTATEIINFEVYSEENNSYQTLCQLVPAQSGKWLKKRIKYIQQKKEENPKDDISSEDIYGSNELTITKFQILDKNLQESYVITINQESHFRIWFKVNSDIEIKQPVFVVAFYSFDGTVISQMISKEKNFKIDSLKGEGYVDFIITSLKIGAGEYNLSVGIFHDIDLVNPIEQNAYCLHDRKYSVKIEQPFGLNMPLGLVYQDFDFSYKVLNG